MRVQFQECSRQSHLPSRPVVVQVHEGPLVPFYLPGVHELPAHLHAVSDVRAAATPLPAALGVEQAVPAGVAAALPQAAPAARLRDGVRHSGRRHGVRVRRFPATWEKRNLIHSLH
ncbi:hypothetical protein CDAR_593391 [Caerostris darwini]|uniref:Uncharacterized protein n=1 Tax=Caerostris darwini TaxID=1538125 RepID=A0AAV4UWN0_9ARAC|nr:hypothetical protein CDAR_593391 [Caerostris darwini]